MHYHPFTMNRIWLFAKKYPKSSSAGVALLLGLIWYIVALPDRLFLEPYSRVLEASDGRLLSASIADDGQWRFPQPDSVPFRFRQALITFEDKRFESHFGVDVRSMLRAVQQNISAGKIVSGGSTISMQVIRLSRKNQSRSIVEKVIEMLLATRLEWRFSKNEIMTMYAAHAPFGGNVVGLDAACWRYFGTAPDQISWGEAALLAVLPNAPALIHPGRNRALLQRKRDRLLMRMRDNGIIDELTCRLAMDEPIPAAPLALPRLARHLLPHLPSSSENGTHRVRSTIRYDLQTRAEAVAALYHNSFKANHIYNLAVLVLDVRSGEVLTYIGNATDDDGHEYEVDVISSPRSSGSILKPFLYAAMLEEGKILPQTLVSDVPLLIDGFSPKNYSRQYDGVVPADEALIRSLNVPAVNLLRSYRYEKLHSLLRTYGMRTLTRPADHYGLSLILGGAEATLWDITGSYASLARVLNRYHDTPITNRYVRSDIHAPTFISSPDDKPQFEQSSILSAASIYLTFDALKEVYRPGEESGWRNFPASRKVAWKTGTSFGSRDAWAIGVTPEFAVGVWVGNADGEGRAGLTGTEVAAPLMFDIFDLLPAGSWFAPPREELQQIEVCGRSGFRISPYCDTKKVISVTRQGLAAGACPYHKPIHLTSDGRYQVNSDCASISSMRTTLWFVLPPVEEYYHRLSNSSYRVLPPWRSDCSPPTRIPSMEMVYPGHQAKLFIPRQLDGSAGLTLFEVAHRSASATLFWHLDGNFLGSTSGKHTMSMHPTPGTHTLTVVDDRGEILRRAFTVLSN